MKIQGRIEMVSEPREFQGIMQIGFRLHGGWYNIPGPKESLEEIRKTMIKKGNEIEFEYDVQSKVLTQIKLIKAAAESEKEDWSEDMIDFETLLKAGHEQGLTEVRTQIITIDPKEKYAVFKATAIGSKGIFEAHGDATSENITGAFIKPHWIRMAETRAIARALRWYTNNAMVATEETAKTKK